MRMFDVTARAASPERVTTVDAIERKLQPPAGCAMGRVKLVQSEVFRCQIT